MVRPDQYSRRVLLTACGSGLGLLAGCNNPSSESAERPHTTPQQTTALEPTSEGTAGPAETTTTAGVIVESLSGSPESVRQAQRSTLSATFRNAGNQPVSRVFPISVGGRTVGEISVQLSPGERASKEFVVQPGVPGEVEVSVGQASTTIVVQQYPVSFVRRDGVSLSLNGERYRFHGSNNDMLFRAPEWYIDTVLSAGRQAGLRVMRVPSVGVGPHANLCYLGDCRDERYSFMPEPGTYGEKAFRGMDYAIFKAKQHGIRLVIPLVDNWSNSGMAQYVEWADTEDLHDDFYTNEECRSLFKDFVNRFLTRTNTYTGVEYRNDPTILLWELANEPQAHGWNEAREEGGEPAPQKLQAWVEEMAPYIKSIDSNHLLSTGGQGFYLDKLYMQEKGESFLQNNAVSAIDACSMHMYPKHWSGDRHDPDTWDDIDIRSLRTHIRDARETAGKPFYLGEFRPATNVDRRDADWEGTDETRASIYQRWYDVLAQRNATGALHWFWYGPMNHETEIVTGRENTDRYNDPHTTYPWDTHTMSVMKSYSRDVGWL